MITRRGFLSGIIAAAAAPAIIRTAGLIMPIKPALYAVDTSSEAFTVRLPMLTPEYITRITLKIMHERLGLQSAQDLAFYEGAQWPRELLVKG